MSRTYGDMWLMDGYGFGYGSTEGSDTGYGNGYGCGHSIDYMYHSTNAYSGNGYGVNPGAGNTYKNGYGSGVGAGSGSRDCVGGELYGWNL